MAVASVSTSWENVCGHLHAGPEVQTHNGRSMVILKCDPMMADIFREEYPDVVPGFYCEKRCWNSVYLDGDVPDEVLKSMCDMSYQLVFEKFPKKIQTEILGENRYYLGEA